MCGSAPGNVLGKHVEARRHRRLHADQGRGRGNKVTAGTRTFDLASGGVEFKVCDDIAPKIPADVTTKLDEIKKGILDGKIVIAKAK